MNPHRYFTCHYHDKVQLYMVLDGHDGSRACDFAQKHIPSVILRSELEGGEEATSRAFHSAFMDTEKQFFLSIDPHITRKITLQIEIAVSLQRAGFVAVTVLLCNLVPRPPKVWAGGLGMRLLLCRYWLAVVAILSL